MNCAVLFLSLSHGPQGSNLSVVKYFLMPEWMHFFFICLFVLLLKGNKMAELSMHCVFFLKAVLQKMKTSMQLVVHICYIV